MRSSAPSFAPSVFEMPTMPSASPTARLMAWPPPSGRATQTGAPGRRRDQGRQCLGQHLQRFRFGFALRRLQAKRLRPRPGQLCVRAVHQREIRLGGLYRPGQSAWAGATAASAASTGTSTAPPAGSIRRTVLPVQQQTAGHQHGMRNGGAAARADVHLAAASGRVQAAHLLHRARRSRSAPAAACPMLPSGSPSSM